MDNLILTANIVTPVFIIVAVGYVLKKFGLINDNFINLSSKIVFSVSLPVLIFMEVSSINFTSVRGFEIILFVYAVTIVSFGLSWLVASPLIKEGKDKGVFIQGSFRGNFAIIGLAILINLYGTEILGKASLVLAFTIPIYNILAIVALTVPVRKEKQLDLTRTVFEILKNPLFLAVIFALPFSYFKIEIPFILRKTGEYLSALTLPLALIGIGGFLSFTEAKKGSGIALISSFLKLVLLPGLGTYAAYLLGFRDEELGVLFILFASPTAIASFIMAEAMGMNSKLAGSILLITTLGSVFTISTGLFILKEMRLI
jgi:predicted permease